MSAAQNLDTVTTRLVGPLDGDAIAAQWAIAEPMLARALERDDWKMKPDQLYEQIAAGMMGLYLAQDFATGETLAAMACEVQDYPNARVFSIAYCGGREAWRWAGVAIAEFEREAARLGCHTVRIPGRKGWGRVFPDYRETHRVFERRIA